MFKRFFSKSIKTESELKRANARLEETLAAAKVASRAKGDFLSTMSHEMRTPMNAIIGMTAIGKASDSIERKNYAFERIEMASNHLLSVINDVLDMSKIEAGKLNIVKMPFSLEQTVKQAHSILAFRLEEKHQQLSVAIDPYIPPVLAGDDRRVIQVLINLLSNATKFTPKGKGIRVEAHLVKQENDIITVRFEVHDEGIGISYDHQDRLFKPFVQAEANTNRKFGGSGLGLSISKHIVELMGGRIWVQSDLGYGAHFFFTVPFDKTDEKIKIHTPQSEAVPDYKGKRLLLAEDIEINREIVISILEPTGITIHCAESGNEALRMFEAGNYDIIFMDVQMPEMDGHEATQRIRALPIPQAKTVPVVAMTANVFDDDVKRSIASGMNAHLGKPLNHADMMKVLKQYLGSGV
jgi:CheY-like chemotaxis protein